MDAERDLLGSFSPFIDGMSRQDMHVSPHQKKYFPKDIIQLPWKPLCCSAFTTVVCGAFVAGVLERDLLWWGSCDGIEQRVLRKGVCGAKNSHTEFAEALRQRGQAC